ncbi:unnamed protein product [Paramecium sonneborni]|uniref:Uncharacterized protein n=1 Tax=Paramecium sonneborni TaxID=65129 RepID=A0A8S1P1N3_9CILI|nr:unnamed protein product [Paramecium sonneborni]
MKKRQKQEDKKRLEEFNKKLQEEDKKRQEEFNKKLEEDKKRQEELIKKLQEEDKKRQEELTKKEKESIKSKIEELFVQLDQLEESFRIQNKKSYIFTYKCTTSEEQQAYNLKTNIQHACQSVLISEQIYRERLDSLTRLISKYK